MTAPRTTFAGGVNPFTGQRTLGVQIVDDAPPTDAPLPNHSKYDDLFDALQVGQAIACETAEVHKYASALRNLIIKRGLRDTLRVAKVKEYKGAKPGTPRGRVWLLEKTSQD